MINKVYSSIEQAVKDIPDGITMLFGGFGGSGVPEKLIEAIINKGIKEITVVSNNPGNGEKGLAKMIQNGQVKKVICTFPVYPEGYVFREKFLRGEIELELVPQGTLAERLRAGGSGVEAFYTPTGVGTEIAQGKEHRNFNGVTCLLERALKADVALIRAKRADCWGNLVYNKTGRNFNPIMAMAAKTTIAEVDEVVELGGLDPEHIVTPAIFVNRVVRRGSA